MTAHILGPINLNQDTVRVPFYCRIPDNIFYQLTPVKMFTIVDFSKSYYHIEPDAASSFLTTLNTPFGRFSFTRIPYCLTVNGDLFQNKPD